MLEASSQERVDVILTCFRVNINFFRKRIMVSFFCVYKRKTKK